MKKYILSLISVLLAVSLCACGIRMDGQGLNNTDIEETETQVLDELEKAFPTEVEEPEKEYKDDETEEITTEGNYPGADVVEIVNLRGDETTVYKLADGTYMDRIDRHFTYNGTDTWTDEDGVEWNEVVKCGYDNDYGDKYKELYSQADQEVLKKNASAITVVGGEHAGKLYDPIVADNLCKVIREITKEARNYWKEEYKKKRCK